MHVCIYAVFVVSAVCSYGLLLGVGVSLFVLPVHVLFWCGRVSLEINGANVYM